MRTNLKQSIIMQKMKNINYKQVSSFGLLKKKNKTKIQDIIKEGLENRREINIFESKQKELTKIN